VPRPAAIQTVYQLLIFNITKSYILRKYVKKVK